MQSRVWRSGSDAIMSVNMSLMAKQLSSPRRPRRQQGVEAQRACSANRQDVCPTMCPLVRDGRLRLREGSG